MFPSDWFILVGGRLRYLAGKTGESIHPLLFIGRFPGPKVDPQCSEAGCTGRLWSAAEHIRLPGDLEIDKAGSHDRGLKLCFQQSAGNSTRPQIDLTFGALWDYLLHQNITDLQTPARFKHPRHFF